MAQARRLYTSGLIRNIAGAAVSQLFLACDMNDDRMIRRASFRCKNFGHHADCWHRQPIHKQFCRDTNKVALVKECECLVYRSGHAKVRWAKSALYRADAVQAGGRVWIEAALGGSCAACVVCAIKTGQKLLKRRNGFNMCRL